jgi:hypothetical protein
MTGVVINAELGMGYYNEKKRKKFGFEQKMIVQNLIPSSWWSSFCPTFSAVNWPARIGFEWNFAFLAAIGADCFMHLSGFSI